MIRVIGLGDSEDESDAKIFSLPDSETGQQSAPHIQLGKPTQSQQGNAEKVLVENIIYLKRLCHMAIKVFRSIFYTIITLLDDSNLNTLQTF